MSPVSSGYRNAASGSADGLLHVLYWLKNEGSPNLAHSLLRADRLLSGRSGAIAMLVPEQDELSDVIRSEGFEVLELDWSDKSYMRLIGRTRDLLRKRSFAGVVCYAIGPHVPIAMACRSLGIPVALHMGNAPPEDRTVRAKIGLQLWAGWPSVTAMCACSEFVAGSSIDAYRLPRRKIRAVLNGIDLDAFDAIRSKRPRPLGSAWTVAMVGSLGHHKDHATLLRAFAELRRRGHDVELRLAGSGVLETELRSLADQLSVSEHVGWGAVADARSVLQEADVFAYSVTPQEGMGIALAEALAAGVPAVVSDVAACREILEGGRLGTLVPSSDPALWADALETARGTPPVDRSDLEIFDIARTLASYKVALGIEG